MAKTSIPPVPAKAKAPGVVMRQGRGRAWITFGMATVQSSKADLKRSTATLDQSRKVMQALPGPLLKPGVTLRARKGVPRFFVDDHDPELVVRELDGERERGRFEDGQFKAVA